MVIMVTKEDIKNIVILNHLTEAMREKLLPHLELQQYEENDVIYRTGDSAPYFYMLKRGKVLLEQRISPTMTICLGAIKPGYSFGWSGALGDQPYTVDMVCAESCDIIAIKGQTLRGLMDADHSLGYRFSQRLLQVIKKRQDLRTVQLVKVLTHHPDILALIEKSDGED